MLAAVVVAVLFKLLNWYVDPTKPSGRKDLILTLAQILGGTALLLGLYFTWRGQQNAQAQLEINRRGQITDRFTQAIDQLGSKDLEIRLGGIYSLERTAYEDQDHHWPIMEVLTTYVRQHAPWNPDEEPNEKPDEKTAHEPDIQAILTVIGRRSEHHRNVEYGLIDLRNTDLQEANLYRANLSGANLRKANFRGANLRYANLQTAHLREAFLIGANLYSAKLQGAFLIEAELQEAELQEADLSEAFLRGANLYSAELQEANLQGAILQGAILQGANLRDANLSETNATEEQLQEAWTLEGTIMPDGSKHP